MSYSHCLEKAGCKIINFEEFGSYQGTWLAFVEYKGEKGIVEGSYGSCSGCDSYQAEFDWNEEPEERNGKYYKRYGKEITKEEYDILIKQYEQKEIDFGLSYLAGGLETKEYYERKLASLDEKDWFDNETKEYCEWALKQNW